MIQGEHALQKALHNAMQNAWMQRGPLALALWPVSLMFLALTRLRRTLYRRGLLRIIPSACPVVVVGNLIVGGAGKTPLVIALIEALRVRGCEPGVISRGHGGSASRAIAPQVARLGGDAGDAQRLGDEVTLIMQRTGVPVVVGRDRAAAAQLLAREFPQVDVIISDDGLQHYRLARAFEIAVFDARGTGNGWLLPAGPLRESPGRLREVDAVVLNGDAAQTGERTPAAPPSFRMHVKGTLAFRLHDRTDSRPLTSFCDNSLLAVAGIGQPSRFFDMLAAAGLRFEALALPDHFDYRAYSFAAHPAQTILMTEKDAVKCTHMNDPRLWVVPVAAELDSGLVKLILEKLRGSAPA